MWSIQTGRSFDTRQALQASLHGKIWNSARILIPWRGINSNQLVIFTPDVMRENFSRLVVSFANLVWTLFLQITLKKCRVRTEYCSTFFILECSYFKVWTTCRNQKLEPPLNGRNSIKLGTNFAHRFKNWSHMDYHNVFCYATLAWKG